MKTTMMVKNLDDLPHEGGEGPAPESAGTYGGCGSGRAVVRENENRSHSAISWVAFEPQIGPPKPIECPEGILSHDWTLSIEEGTVSLSTSCSICNDGIQAITEPEDFAMEEIPVRLEARVERSYDGDSWVVWDIVPSGRAS